jgi:hypothetical protein
MGPVGSAAQIHHSLLQPGILTVPSRPCGFGLVARVTSKSIPLSSNLQHQIHFVSFFAFFSIFFIFLSV